MSDNSIITTSPPLPLSCTCKEAIPDTESGKGITLEDSIHYIIEIIEMLGIEHCKAHCVNCRKNAFAGIKPLDPTEHQRIKETLHSAFRNLPFQTYSSISFPTNGRCPACIIIESFKQLVTLARYSKCRPFGYGTFPCYEDSFEEAAIGMDALLSFDINDVAIRRMPPEIKREIRETALVAQKIIKKLKDIQNGEKEKLSTADLWVLLDREASITSLAFPPSFEWTQWAKAGLLNNNCKSHGEHISVTLLIAFSCYSALDAEEITNIPYGNLRELYAAAYYLSSGETINNRQLDDILRENTGSFLVLADENFGVRYYAQTTLGKTIARKYIGAPPSFFPATLQGNPSPEAIPTSIVVEPAIAPRAEASSNFDSVFAANLAQDNKTNQSVIVERADKNEATAKSAVENNVLKLEANPNISIATHNPADTVEKTGDVYEKALSKGIEIGRMMTAPISFPPKDAAIVPPIGGWTTRVKAAEVVKRDTKTLKNWEDVGQTPDGIPWPRGERQGNSILYRIEEVWPSILRLRPDIDREKQKQILSDIMEMRNSGGDEVPF